MQTVAADPDIELVEQVIDAYNGGDPDAVVRLYHPEVTIVPTPEVSPPGTVYHGHDGFRVVTSAINARFASIRIVPRELRRVEGAVLALWTSIERPHGSEEAVEREAVHLLTCEDGLVRRVEGFRTVEDALRAARRQAPMCVVKRYLAAFERGDADAMAAECHPDVRVFPSGAFVSAGTTYEGREGILSMVSSYRWPHYRIQSPELHEIAGRVRVSMVVIAGEGAAETTHDLVLLFTLERDQIRLVEGFSTPGDGAAATMQEPTLTPREREIFRLLALGFSGRDIAEQLFLSPETVRTHVHNGVRRLGARTRGQAIAIALTRGEIRL